MHSRVAVLAALMVAPALVACDEGQSSESVSLFPENVSEVYNKLVTDREKAGSPKSSLPEGVEWMPDLDAAFAKAKAEDKPVLIATSVPENGNPANDV